jgi:hypothetical protein
VPPGQSQSQNQWLASMILTAVLSGSIVADGFNLSFLLKHPWESIPDEDMGSLSMAKL